MSLFKARDWWSAVLGEGEEFDQGCLCVGDVDNSGTGHGQLSLGLYSAVECQALVLMNEIIKLYFVYFYFNEHFK